MFHDVSVLFSDVVGFTHICSLISPMEVVTMLNNMYTAFDQISEEHNVYKVGIQVVEVWSKDTFNPGGDGAGNS